MSNYLVAKCNTASKSYTLQTEVPSSKPYLKVSGSYLPLTTDTSATGIKVKNNNVVYNIQESKSYSTTLTSSSSGSSQTLECYSSYITRTISGTAFSTKSSTYGTMTLNAAANNLRISMNQVPPVVSEGNYYINAPFYPIHSWVSSNPQYTYLSQSIFSAFSYLYNTTSSSLDGVNTIRWFTNNTIMRRSYEGIVMENTSRLIDAETNTTIVSSFNKAFCSYFPWQFPQCNGAGFYDGFGRTYPNIAYALIMTKGLTCQVESVLSYYHMSNYNNRGSYYYSDWGLYRYYTVTYKFYTATSLTSTKTNRYYITSSISSFSGSKSTSYISLLDGNFYQMRYYITDSLPSTLNASYVSSSKSSSWSYTTSTSNYTTTISSSKYSTTAYTGIMSTSVASTTRTNYSLTYSSLYIMTGEQYGRSFISESYLHPVSRQIYTSSALQQTCTATATVRIVTSFAGRMQNFMEAISTTFSTTNTTVSASFTNNMYGWGTYYVSSEALYLSIFNVANSVQTISNIGSIPRAYYCGSSTTDYGSGTVYYGSFTSTYTIQITYTNGQYQPYFNTDYHYITQQVYAYLMSSSKGYLTSSASTTSYSSSTNTSKMSSTTALTKTVSTSVSTTSK